MAINIAEEDAVAKVKEMTGGYGCDVYLEGTGAPPAVLQGLNMLRKLGRFVEYSVFKEDVTVDWSIISDDKELDVLRCPPRPELLARGHPAHRVGPASRWTRSARHQLPLSKFQEGLDLVASGKESIKVTLDPRRRLSRARLGGVGSVAG